MHILGIDIGGTGIKGAPVDTETGELLAERQRIPTPAPATPDAMINTVAEVADYFKWKGPVGCGFPAAIKNETVMTAANIDKSWIGLNAGKKIQKKINCPTHMVNDVDAAGLAESTFGAGKGEKGVVIMAAVGTGIGTALISNGHLFENSELGHLLLHGMIAEKYISNAVRKKQKLSWEVFSDRLSEYLQRLEFLFWPDLFIIGGGVSKHSESFFPLLKVDTKVIAAKLLNNAGIVGSALAARNVGIKGG
ncbi:ROK family protein [Fulvivirgaceae bacterium BMA12]|uniref:ROK family protein n=1 Tax=Agaribacillus aureus TaxID=3051825 RepID=A0ABT8L2V8_9BACT|nr:ROK family protein [Fulvivirgaceae bacterium BMA12]